MGLSHLGTALAEVTRPSEPLLIILRRALGLTVGYGVRWDGLDDIWNRLPELVGRSCRHTVRTGGVAAGGTGLGLSQVEYVCFS